jgi:hypothetical protein
MTLNETRSGIVGACSHKSELFIGQRWVDDYNAILAKAAANPQRSLGRFGTSERQAGGAYAKVIRWAFEKQGLYQPQLYKRPVTREGPSPLVDVYIENGRRGEYQYQANYWNCRAIWNRHAADGN